MGFTQDVQLSVEGNTASSERVGPELMAAATARDLRSRRHTFKLKRRSRSAPRKPLAQVPVRVVSHTAPGRCRRKKGRIGGLALRACVPSTGEGLPPAIPSGMSVCSAVCAG